MAGAPTDEKPVALTLKVDHSTYVRLCTLGATERRTNQDILQQALPSLGNQFGLGGTALLIVVSVTVETMKQLEAQLMMRNYEGFIR